MLKFCKGNYLVNRNGKMRMQHNISKKVFLATLLAKEARQINK